MVDILLSLLIFIGLGVITGVLLTIASKIFEVHEDERVEHIYEVLPQINCGACGFAGCKEYAHAVVANGVAINLCVVGGKESSDLIASVMDISQMEVLRRVATVKCNGSCNVTKNKYDFECSNSCSSQIRFYNGSKSCDYGCLGCGDCVNACDQNSVSIINGVAVICKETCIGCAKCVEVCPKKIIEMTNYENSVLVACSSKASGKDVRLACSVGCIGCKKCEKTCEYEAISVLDNLAVIDYERCVKCGKCATVCPVGAIVTL